MKRTLASLLFLAIFSAGALGLAPGELAPDFTAKNQEGKDVKLSTLRGNPVLIYFYPKDDTPGCTKEACSFRDEYSKFKKLGVVVLGVSRQDGKSHQAFHEKYHLPFDLLIDVDGDIGKAFGVGSMPVVGYHKRQSVLIDKQGKLFKFYDSVDPSTHVAEVLADLKKLGGT